MKNKSVLLWLFLILVGFNSFIVNAQRKSKRNKENRPEITEVITAPDIATTPKLVVGIVVDQMRYDYLTRFWSQYGEGGFKRLVNDGFNCKNNHFNYAPTVTAAGHASVYTGTTPSNHGIIGNDWYDKFADEMVYCAGMTPIVPLVPPPMQVRCPHIGWRPLLSQINCACTLKCKERSSLFP